MRSYNVEKWKIISENENRTNFSHSYYSLSKDIYKHNIQTSSNILWASTRKRKNSWLICINMQDVFCRRLAYSEHQSQRKKVEGHEKTLFIFTHSLCFILPFLFSARDLMSIRHFSLFCVHFNDLFKYSIFIDLSLKKIWFTKAVSFHNCKNWPTIPMSRCRVHENSLRNRFHNNPYTFRYQQWKRFIRVVPVTS